MKMSSRMILRAARLYGVADDQTALKSMKALKIQNYDDYVQAEFVLGKKRYALLFGACVEESMLSELWPEMPETAEILPNPLDPTNFIAPFQGKYLAFYHVHSGKQRLDVYLSTEFDPTISRSLWQKYIKSGAVSVNGQTVLAPKAEMSDTDDVAISFPEAEYVKHDVEIIYEDNDVIVINKPAGMLTHAKGGIPGEQTAADLFREKSTYGLDTNRPGIIHRLDRQTSGVLIGAKNADAATYLQDQFAKRTVKKSYVALIDGIPSHLKAHIDLPISRHPTHPSTFRVDANGKTAQTLYEVLAHNQQQSFVRLSPTTGRTHQLRVHMAHIGHPIHGDTVYGKPAERMFLHAEKLTLIIPSGEQKTFTAPIPECFIHDFPDLLAQL